MLHRRIYVLILTAFLPAASLHAQAVVTGTITDSVSHHPVVGAMVQLVPEGATNRVKSATSDSVGVYRIDSVVPGQYIIGFFHPTLDSIGIDLSPKRLTIAGAGEQRVDMA